MTVGAYGWNATNPWSLTEIVKPADCVIVDGATTIKATLAVATAALVALSLY